MEPSKEGIFQRLKHSLQLLACPPDIQLNLLPKQVCKADELALDFGQWRETVLHNYSTELARGQIAVLSELEEGFKSLGNELWTDEAIQSDQKWNEIRKTAARALESFGWPKQIPPSYSSEYVINDD